MNRPAARSLILLIALCVCPTHAQDKPPRIAACSLLTKAEVKKHLPWNDIVDRIPVEEEPVGAAGSSCNYPSVFIQVFPAVRLVRGQPSSEPGWQPLSGVGDEAWFRPNRTEYAELYVKTATHTVTIQANANGNVEAVKPGAISLAKALLTKLH